MLDFPYQVSTGLPYIALFVEAVQWLAWPVAIVVVARVLKGPLSNAMNKLIELSYGNVKAVFASQASHAESLDQPLSKLQLPMDPAPNVIIDNNLSEAQKQVREFVMQELEEFPENQKMNVLIVSVATERLQKHFALAYANIFGSQIRALELLNQRNKVILIGEASAMFTELQSQHEEFRDWTLERYLSYLRNFDLIEISDREIRLTPIGKDFVVWLGVVGLDKGKLL